MKIAYLILAHANPKHLSRLINALSEVNTTFFIHIDKKSDLEKFSKIEAPNIYFIQDRVDVYWGGFSQVSAIINLINATLLNSDEHQRLVLLSGVDYPVKPTAYIRSFFERHTDKEFINLVKMPSEEANKPISRLTKFRNIPSDSWYKKVINKVLNKIGVKRNYKHVLGDSNPCAGSAWWALTRASCEYISEFVTNTPKFNLFFEKSTCPDEMFFQTILGNSMFKDNIYRNLIYTQWVDGRPNPENITEKHIPLLNKKEPLIIEDVYGKGELLFARKFTDESSPALYSINKARVKTHHTQ